MTDRQENLKEEILKISNRIQLGIREDDHDWFYMFVYRISQRDVQRLDYSHNGWLIVSEMPDLSRNFIDEFKNRLYLIQVMRGNIKQFTIQELLQNTNASYLCGNDYYLVLDIAKDERLTDALVYEYETLFDQTHGRCGSNAVPWNDKTAWHFILNSKNISWKTKEAFLNKPTHNIKTETENPPPEKKSTILGFFKKIRGIAVKDKEQKVTEVLELKKQGVSNVKIARRFGVSEGAIRKWIKKANKNNIEHTR